MTEIDRQQKCFKGNRDHLNVLLDSLKNGKIRIWNDWRMDNAEEIPDLKGINLVGARLIGIDLSGADLSGADLTRADLSASELSGVVLVEANLAETRFVHATLYGGGLARANLRDADLDGAVLNSATLTQANLTGANIRGIGQTGWNIENIECDYVYRDQEGRVREPVDVDFDPGEFENLYRSSPKIEHIFVDEFTPIDILIMDRVVQEINDQNPEYELKLDSFHARGKSRAEFLIKDVRDSGEILTAIKAKHEEQRSELVQKLEVANMKAETFREALSMSLKQPTLLIEHVEFNDYREIWLNCEATSDDYRSKLIRELSELREALKNESKTIEQDQAIGEIADAEQAAKAGDGPTAVKHLKNVGKWVLDVSTNLGTNIATELIKKSMGL